MFLFKPKFLIPLALFSGLLSTYGVWGYLREQETEIMRKAGEAQPVVVAALNLAFGDSLSELNMEVRKFPKELVPAGSFATEPEIMGRVIKTDIVAGEPILDAKLAPDGSAGGVLSQIPPGMRAMTVAVNVVSGVGGFVLPKSRVDILATISQQQNREETTTRVLLQDVLVLAVDQTFRKNDDDPVTVKSVTLLVSPEQAEKLALASTEGKLQLVLRNTADSASITTSGARLNSFIQGAAPPKAAAPVRAAPRARPQTRAAEAPVAAPAPAPKAAEPPPPKTKVIEVIRSNERTRVEFDESGQPIPEKKR